MMEFLYFPQDKTEYIPSVITLVLFAIGAIITTRIFFKIAKKEEQKANELYKDQMNMDEGAVEGSSSTDETHR